MIRIWLEEGQFLFLRNILKNWLTKNSFNGRIMYETKISRKIESIYNNCFFSPCGVIRFSFKNNILSESPIVYQLILTEEQKNLCIDFCSDRENFLEREMDDEPAYVELEIRRLHDMRKILEETEIGNYDIKEYNFRESSFGAYGDVVEYGLNLYSEEEGKPKIGCETQFIEFSELNNLRYIASRRTFSFDPFKRWTHIYVQYSFTLFISKQQVSLIKRVMKLRLKEYKNSKEKKKEGSSKKVFLNDTDLLETLNNGW